MLQSYPSSLVTLLLSTLTSVPVLVSAQPELLLSNGPGTALPLLTLARVLTTASLVTPCKVRTALDTRYSDSSVELEKNLREV